MDYSKNLDWPGWPLKNCPYGKEFDYRARKRMLSGSNMLLPLIKKYKEKMGEHILEIGPFFVPLITKRRFPKSKIFYWENDPYVLDYFKHNKKSRIFPIFCNLNRLSGGSLLTLQNENQKIFKKLGQKNISFDSVAISQVINYVDYKLLLATLKIFLKKDGLIFINNVVNYGIPEFFSEKRPKKIFEITKAVEESGYIIIEKQFFKSPNKKYQKNKRLILVAKNIIV